MGWHHKNLLNGYCKKVVGHKMDKEGLFEWKFGSQQVRNCYAIAEYDFKKGSESVILYEI